MKICIYQKLLKKRNGINYLKNFKIAIFRSLQCIGLCTIHFGFEPNALEIAQYAFPRTRLPFAFNASIAISGEISVFVYVVCLDGVPAYGVENMSEVFEGVLQASSRNVRYMTREFDYSCLYPYPIYKEFLVNASVVKVTDWMAYRFLVEYGRNIIIVNVNLLFLTIFSQYRSIPVCFMA